MSKTCYRAALRCVLVIGALTAGCAPTRYTNPGHPEYSTQQFETDRTQCEKANSKVTSHQGYDVQTEIVVDQDAVKLCLAQKGWQPAEK